MKGKKLCVRSIFFHIRYHCPISIFLKFIRPKVKTYKRKIWNYQRADFAKYRQILSEHDLPNSIRSNELDSSVQIVAVAIFNAADKSIPNKIVNIRPTDYPWITCHIKSLIRKRRRVYYKFKKTNNAYFWNQFKVIRNNVIDLIRKSKQNYFDQLENIFCNENLNS